MILAVNVGNTHITIGGYQDDQRVFSARLRTSLQCSSDEYAIKLLDLLRLHQIPRSRLSGAILSSVVPAISGVVLVALGKLCPMRVLTTTVAVSGGDETLLPVRTAEAIPLALHAQAMDLIRGLVVNAPIRMGDVVLENLLDTNINLIASMDIDQA